MDIVGDFQQSLLSTLETMKGIDRGADDAARELINAPGESGESMLESLGLSIPSLELVDKKTNEETEEKSDVIEDYQRARSCTYTLQDASLVLLENVLKMAVTTSNVQCYRVANELITNIRGLNQDLMNTQKTLQETKGKHRMLPDKPVIPGTNTPIEEGDTVTYGIRLEKASPRKSTRELLEEITKLKASGVDLSKVTTETVYEAEIDNGDSETGE